MLTPATAYTRNTRCLLPLLPCLSLKHICPQRQEFFVTFKMNLTASTGAEQTQLNQDRVIALRRHCPVQNSTTTSTEYTTTATTPATYVLDAQDDGDTGITISDVARGLYRHVDHFLAMRNAQDTIVMSSKHTRGAISHTTTLSFFELSLH